MSLALDPVVIRKLTQFRRRRTMMLIARGLCAGVVSFLACMAVIAFIDWNWLLTDATRWCLSGAAYAVVIAMVWLSCIRGLIDTPAREEIATQVEELEPELRENLLSAVELATDDPGALHDSPVFRSLLQGQVAKQMGHVAVPRLLPIKLLGRWITAALLMGALAFCLLNFAGPQLRQLFTRAILPGANIARVSRIQIAVLEPTPHSLTLAEDETVAVVVDVSGGRFGDVVLETYSPKQGTIRQTMRGRDAREFAANLHVGEEPIDYRIFAGDAITKKHRIESVARPHVVAFHKTYEYPEYAGLDAKQVSETSGDLIELEGTTAQLVLELDQEVSLAELRISSNENDEIRTISLVPDGQRRMRASVPIEQAGVYKVQLVSKATGFESTYSPRYEIRPIPDLIPRAGFVDQTETNLILPPNDLMSLRAMAEDDLSLVSLDQMVSVNGRKWRKLALETTASETEGKHRFNAKWQWDFLPLKLKAGDQVTTKLVATDRKGNLGESIPLNIVIASADFDPNRHTTLKRKSKLYDDLAEFASLAETNQSAAQESVKRIISSESAAERRQEQTTLLDLAARQREKADEVLEHLQQIERAMPPGADAYDLELIGQLIARIRSEYSTEPIFLFAANDLDNHPDHQKTNLDKVKHSFERTADNAHAIERGFKILLAHNMLSSVAVDMHSLQTQQQIVVDHSMDSWERLLRQQIVVIRHMDELEKLIRQHRRALPQPTQDRLKELLGWSQRQRENLQQASESEDKIEQLKNTARTVLRELGDRQNLIDGGIAGELVSVRQDFWNRADSLFGPLDRVAHTVMEEHQIAVRASEAKDSVQASELEAQSKLKLVAVELKHRNSLEQLRVRRVLNQSRVDGDPQYAADAGLAYRAVIAVLGQRLVGSAATGTSHQALREIAPAYRTLESGHELVQARDWVANLYSRENWKSQHHHSRFDHPRQWDLITKGLEYSAHRLRQAGMPNEIVSKLDQVRWSQPVRRAHQKISERRWKLDQTLGAGRELKEIKSGLDEVIDELQPIMAEARAALAKYAPTIPEMAEKAAEQLRELEEETLAAADEADKPQPTEPKPEENATEDEPAELAELKQQQDVINQQIDDLFDALVDEANSQDLLNEQQREAARDADDSIALIEQPAVEMNKALEEAQRSETPTEQAEQLANAAEQQEKTAQALMQVAEHFEKVENSQVSTKTSKSPDESGDAAENKPVDNPLTESRNQLRNAEKEMGLAQKLDEQYKDAQEISEMTEKSPEDLLAELEAELETNPAMQDALSEITKNTLEEAQNVLEASAEQDKNLQTANEQSDTNLAEKKKQVSKELKEIAREASELANANVAQARHFAERGKAEEAKKKLEQTQQKLREAANQANSANENTLMEDLVEAVKETSESLAEASDALDEAKKQTDVAKNKEVHQDENQRKAEKKVGEDNLRQIKEQQKREAQSVVRQKQNEKRQADSQVRREENDVKREQRNAEKAKKNLARKPDDQKLKNQLAQAQSKQKIEQQQLDAARKNQKQAEQGVREAEQKAKQTNNQKTPQLNDKNPAAQLADNYAAKAVEKVNDLEQRLEALKKEVAQERPLTPSKPQLAEAEKKQDEIQQNVEQVAQDVARAARHEERLNNKTAAKAIESAASEIQQVAENEVADAKQQLAAAEEAAGNPEDNGKPGEAGDGQGEGDASENAKQAQSALAKSEAALSQQAENLEAARAEGSEPADDQSSQTAAAENGENDTGQPAQGAEAGQGSEPGQATELAQGSEPGQGSEPAQGSAPGQATELAQGSEPAQGAEPGQGSEPAQGSTPGQATELAQGSEPGQGSEPAQGSEPSQSSKPSQGSQPASGSGSARQSPQEIARAEQLAQTLDELDRQLAEASSASESSPSSAPSPGQPPLSTLANAAQTARAQMAAARAQAKQQAAESLQPGEESSEQAALFGPDSDLFKVVTVDRSEEGDWGQLRDQSAEEMAKGRSEKVSEEYRKSIETYFRVLAERARKNK